MQKLYCYVDETGQDTKGKMFLVAVVIVEEEREKLRLELRKIEKESGLGSTKWVKASYQQREKYIGLLLEAKKEFAGKIYFDYHQGAGGAFVDLMMLATAKAINEKAKEFYQAIVIVDGLKKSEKGKFAVGLRKLKIRVKKVRGARDESDEFVRLADIIAGFTRKSIEGNIKMLELFNKASKVGIIKSV